MKNIFIGDGGFIVEMLRTWLMTFVFAPVVCGFLDGRWIQAYSNYYVQQTSEIDWKCVTVQVNDTAVTKRYLEHGDPALHREVVRDNYFADVFLKYTTDDYSILTGKDDKTLLVWTRNYTRFVVRGGDAAVSALAASWGYDDLYKALRPSYDLDCLARGQAP